MNSVNNIIEMRTFPLAYGSPYGYFEPVVTPILPNIDLCFYCGNLIKIDTDQCPGCGARDWKRKRRG